MTNFTMDTQGSPLQPITLPISGAQTPGKAGFSGKKQTYEGPMASTVEGRQCKQTTRSVF